MQNKNVGIITFETFHGKKDIGSSKIRGQWLVNYWEEAEMFRQGTKYDAVIFQKVYWPEYAKNFEGVKILDLCDPDFLAWNYKTVEMIGSCDAVTTSSPVLRDAIKKFTNKPVIWVPDRVDLNANKEKKVHSGDARTAVWFGYSQNQFVLNSTLEFLDKYGLDLIVISDKGYILPPPYNSVHAETMKPRINLTNYPWRSETVNNDIIKGDIFLAPYITSGKWKYKTNNKELISKALGLPIARSTGDLKRLLAEDERKADAEQGFKELEENWDVRYSVDEMKDIIRRIKDKEVFDDSIEKEFNSRQGKVLLDINGEQG